MYFDILHSCYIFVLLVFNCCPSNGITLKYYGEKSKQKCEEYSKAVYSQEDAAVLLPNAPSQNVSECGIVEVPLIIGGVSTGIKEFPHMAALGYGNEYDIFWMCGGSLISENYVLTAAHCLKSKDKGSVKWVRMGDRSVDESDPEARVQTFKVKEAIPHPSFQPRQSYFDLGLIKLDRSAQFNGFVRPACLSTDLEDNHKKVIATGFGKTDFYHENNNKKLLKVHLSQIPYEQCKQYFESDVLTTRLRLGLVKSQMCAGELRGGKDTCQGDSGGPLQQMLAQPYCMYSIIGITSFGKFCGFRNSPAIYTRVSHFIPWIESIVWPRGDSGIPSPSREK